MSEATSRVMQVLKDQYTGARVEAYFAALTGSGESYTGRLFEQFGGGGDRPDAAMQFVAEDLLAVEALSVNVPSDTAHEILYGSVGRRLSDLLVDVPVVVDLGSSEAAKHVADGAPAALAWTLLDEQPGIGWVTAGKLLARKRPRLIPVYDDVVRCVLGHPTHAWHTLDVVLGDDGVQLELEGLRTYTPAAVSRLRSLDVAVWMFHHEHHRYGRCEQFGGSRGARPS